MTKQTEDFRRMAYQAVDIIVDHLERLPEGHVHRPVGPQARQDLVSEPIPEQATAPEQILDEIQARIFPFPMGNNHPRFFAWVNSPASPITIVASMLAAGLNPSSAGGDHAAIYVELAVLNWMKGLFGFPESAMGLLVGGGSGANLIGLAVARHTLLGRVGWHVRSAGLNGAPPLTIYTSDQTHSSIVKATELLGIGSDSIRQIPTREDYAMDPRALENLLRADPPPGLAIVVASAGTVNTGAVDPLAELADIAAERGFWFHVDGAYGAPGILCEETRPRFSGIERADSLAVDPHKWLYVAVDCGCVLVRDADAMRSAFSLVPPYLTDDSGAPPWFAEYTFEQTRPFRALKLWAAIRERGLEGYRRDIAHDLEMARRLADQIRSSEDFELAAPVTLSIVAFRYRLASLSLDQEAVDRLNAALPKKIQEMGKLFLTGTTLRNRAVLRVCFVNFKTTEADLDAILPAIRAAVKELG